MVATASTLYITQPLFALIDNFQNYDPNIVKKPKLKIVDYRKNDTEIQEFKNRYPFVNWDDTHCHFGGFNKKAIDIIFEMEDKSWK